MLLGKLSGARPSNVNFESEHDMRPAVRTTARTGNQSLNNGSVVMTPASPPMDPDEFSRRNRVSPQLRDKARPFMSDAVHRRAKVVDDRAVARIALDEYRPSL